MVCCSQVFELQGQKITNCKFCRNEILFFCNHSASGKHFLSLGVRQRSICSLLPHRNEFIFQLCSSTAMFIKNIYAFVCLLVSFGFLSFFLFPFCMFGCLLGRLLVLFFLPLCFSLLAFCLFDLCCFALLLSTSLCFVLAWLHFVLVCLLARWLVCFFACLFASLLVCLFASLLACWCVG